MADYSTIKGFTIQSLASDPVASEVLAGTWASGTAINTGRADGVGQGTTTAALFEGGGPADTELWNGTTWTEVNDLTTGRAENSGAGTQTAALFFAGKPAGPAFTESWDGTCWTETNDLNTGRALLAGCGIQTAAMAVGGESIPGVLQDVTEIYDGTSWTEVNDLNTARMATTAFGTTTAAINACGQEPAYGGKVESYDGTSWTEVSDVNTARGNTQQSGFGIQTAGMIFGGTPPPAGLVNTETYNGTSWTEVGDLGTANRLMGGAGTNNTSALSIGGAPGTKTTVEEWTIPATVSLAQEGQVWYNSSAYSVKGFKKTFGAGTWASGGIMTNPRYSFAGFGTQTAAVSATGTGAPGVITKTEEYNGTAWTEVNDNLSGGDSISGCGTLTAGIINARSPSSLLTESYDGTCWTEVNDMNTPSRGKRTDAGTQAAGLCVGGENHPAVMVNTELWDGTSWTEVAGDLNNGRSTQDGGTGTQTAALVAGGTPPADSPVYDYAETWDGTSWTEVNDLNTARSYGVAFGEQTDCYYAGGVATTLRALVESYNGTSWTEVADLGTAAKKAAGGGDQTAGIVMGGATAGDPTGLAQEWSIPDAIKTFTAS